MTKEHENIQCSAIWVWWACVVLSRPHSPPSVRPNNKVGCRLRFLRLPSPPQLLSMCRPFQTPSCNPRFTIITHFQLPGALVPCCHLNERQFSAIRWAGFVLTRVWTCTDGLKMLALTQLNNNVKPHPPQQHSIFKEPPSERCTYRFIQIRGSSFRYKCRDREPCSVQFKVVNDLHYEFRRPSVVDVDEQTCAQFKVAQHSRILSLNFYLYSVVFLCRLYVHRWCCWETAGWVKLASWSASKTRLSCLALSSPRSESIIG